MRASRAVLISMMVVAIAACGDTADQPGEEEAVPTWVTDVAAVADAVEAQPAAADSILRAHDMTRATLDSLLYEIAADPTLTAAYQDARR